MNIESFAEKKGEEFFVSAWQDIDQDRINTFADATLDHQWIHVDPEKCATDSPWQTPIAHGFLTLSLLPYFLNQFSDQLKLKRKINYGLNRVRFTEAVRVGDRVRGRFKLIEAAKLKGPAWKVIIEVTIEIKDREKPACIAENIVLMVA